MNLSETTAKTKASLSASAARARARAMAELVKYKPDPANLTSDLIAGFTFAAVNVPQGLAYALLAGLPPVLGLYALMIGTPVGALVTSSVYMNVSSTSALSASVGDALGNAAGDQRVMALAALVAMIGLFQIVLGALKLGWLMRFVPNSVMVGFVTGVAVLIILGQLGNFTGFYSTESGKIKQLADLIVNSDQMSRDTLAVGVLTIVLIVSFERSALRRFALVLAMVVASAVPLLMGWTDVRIVRDTADIPRALPALAVPSLSLAGDLVLSAAALALLGLVQGASVSQIFPNPGGKAPDMSRDFIGQGVANVANAFVMGIPVGGSSSGTAVLMNAGAKSRWANIFAGLFVAAIVLLIPNLVEQLAMPALAGLLVIVGLRLINVDAIRSVWQTGRISRVSAGITFVSTLIVPLQTAILIGVIVAVLLMLFQEADKVRINELVWDESGDPIERPGPATLHSAAVTVLDVDGALFFAAAASLEGLLPAADEARNAFVVLRLRGRKEIGTTLINVLGRYAQQLRAGGGGLILAEVSRNVNQQLLKSGAIEKIGAANVFLAEPRVYASTKQAREAALAKLAAADMGAARLDQPVAQQVLPAPAPANAPSAANSVEPSAPRTSKATEATEATEVSEASEDQRE
jgi:SulP family sulfate permease